LNWCNYAFN